MQRKMVFHNLNVSEKMILAMMGQWSWDRNNISKKSPKYPIKTTHSRQSKPTGPKNQFLKKYFAISKLYNDFWTQFFHFYLEQSAVEKNEASFPLNNWTIQITPKSPGNPQILLAMFYDSF